MTFQTVVRRNRLINDAAQRARSALQSAANTQTIRHEGTAAPVLAAPEGSAHKDEAGGPIALLRQLGQLRDAGVLSGEEFETKKREILSRM